MNCPICHEVDCQSRYCDDLSREQELDEAFGNEGPSLFDSPSDFAEAEET